MGAGSGAIGETCGTAGVGSTGAGEFSTTPGDIISDDMAGTPTAGTSHPQSGTSITALEVSHPQLDDGSTAVDSQAVDSTAQGAVGVHDTTTSQVVTGSQHGLGTCAHPCRRCKSLPAKAGLNVNNTEREETTNSRIQ